MNIGNKRYVRRVSRVFNKHHTKLYSPYNKYIVLANTQNENPFIFKMIEYVCVKNIYCDIIYDNRRYIYGINYSKADYRNIEWFKRIVSEVLPEKWTHDMPLSDRKRMLRALKKLYSDQNRSPQQLTKAKRHSS